jgi:hypothetical protein
MPKHAGLHLEKSTVTIPLPGATEPLGTISTVNKTSSTGISAKPSPQNAPKHNDNSHLPPVPEKNLVSNSAFSANSAGRSLKNYAFNANEERALNDSELKVAAGWRQFVSGKSALIGLIKALTQVKRWGTQCGVGGNPLRLPGRPWAV